jgi:Ca2+-binding EF-hand superfamily protein
VFPLRRESSGGDGDAVDVTLSVSSLGLEVSGKSLTADGGSQSFSFFALEKAEKTGEGFAFDYHLNGEKLRSAFETDEGDHIVEVIGQQQSRIELRQDVQLHKQKRKLRTAFNTVDRSGNGSLDVQELGVLLRSLGEDLTEAELRERMRSVDSDSSGEVDFDEFAALIFQWQEQELHDVFHYFDEDDSGNISLDEMCKAIRALSEREVTEGEAKQRATMVDGDGSGEIDMDEFVAFARSMMSITPENHFDVEQKDEGHDDATSVELKVSSLGMEVYDGEETQHYSFVTLNAVTETSDGFLFDYHQHHNELRAEYLSNDGPRIVEVICQQRSRVELRQDVHKDKQKRKLRAAFDVVDTSGDGTLDVKELGVLLRSLGEDLTEAELRYLLRGMAMTSKSFNLPLSLRRILTCVPYIFPGAGIRCASLTQMTVGLLSSVSSPT